MQGAEGIVPEEGNIFKPKLNCLFGAISCGLNCIFPDA